MEKIEFAKICEYFNLDINSVETIMLTNVIKDRRNPMESVLALLITYVDNIEDGPQERILKLPDICEKFGFDGNNLKYVGFEKESNDLQVSFK